MSKYVTSAQCSEKVNFANCMSLKQGIPTARGKHAELSNPPPSCAPGTAIETQTNVTKKAQFRM